MSARPVTLTQLFAKLRKECDDFRLEYTVGSDDVAVVDAILDHMERTQDQAEAAGLLAE